MKTEGKKELVCYTMSSAHQTALPLVSSVSLLSLKCGQDYIFLLHGLETAQQ